MITAKERLLRMIKDIPESEVADILDYAEHLKEKLDPSFSKEMAEFREIKIEYWDSDIYDEVWKDV